MFAPYICMKKITILIWLCQAIVVHFCGPTVFAETAVAETAVAETAAAENAAQKNNVPNPVISNFTDLFSWNLLWSGSWYESASNPMKGTLYNRGELKINILPLNLMLRGQILDRHPFNLDPDDLWGDPEKWVTNYIGGIYHRFTSSRILFGVIDESGLPARIRNPWTRSPPYSENHRPFIADLKTTAAGTKEDEIYLYLSSPVISFAQNNRIRGFISAQTETGIFEPAISGGVDITLNKDNRFLLETFYTAKTLPPLKINTWFSNTSVPPLPEREFRLYSAGLLFSCPSFSVSSDFAMSETFAWGTDIYVNFGLSFSPLLQAGTRARPLLISLAADGAGERFVNRDGLISGEGFRIAGKIEWKERYSSLLRLNMVLRGSGYQENFNRSTAGIYYRFPAGVQNNKKPVRLTVISFSADRNAVNPQKIRDVFSGNAGLRLNLQRFGINSPFGINLTGSVKGLSALENPSLFPVIDERWIWESASVSCELTWSPDRYQFRTRVEYATYAEKEEKWGFSMYGSVRFKYGRLSIKASSPDFPERWNLNISWRLETQSK